MKAKLSILCNYDAIARYLMLIMGGTTLISALLSPFFIIAGILIYIRKKLSQDLPAEYRAYFATLKKTLYYALVIYVIMFSMPFILLMLHGKKNIIEYFIKYGQEVTSLFLLIAGIYHYWMLQKRKPAILSH